IQFIRNESIERNSRLKYISAAIESMMFWALIIFGLSVLTDGSKPYMYLFPCVFVMAMVLVGTWSFIYDKSNYPVMNLVIYRQRCAGKWRDHIFKNKWWGN
ncbi:hypothetical protein, partial [Paucilactobacillus wasatchensis]